jgi:1-acyl-sn-glycerol-3-phosphate acyltransferase
MALFMDGVKVDGRENLPPGPKIIVGNHPHVTDSFVLPFIVPEKIHFFIQEETFTLSPREIAYGQCSGYLP